MEQETFLDEFLAKYKIPLAMSLVGLILLIGGVFSSGIFSKTLIKSTQSPRVSASQVSSTVAVDVSGEVVNPGVYNLPAGSRIEEVIKQAGGVTEKADPVYVSKTLNLAQKVTDGMKIYIPQAQESGQQGSGAVAGPPRIDRVETGTSTQESLVNINSATLPELDKLPGVGSVTAQNIVDKRPFSSIEELLIKKAVTKATYEKIKDLVGVW